MGQESGVQADGPEQIRRDDRLGGREAPLFQVLQTHDAGIMHDGVERGKLLREPQSYLGDVRRIVDIELNSADIRTLPRYLVQKILSPAGDDDRIPLLG